MWICIYVYVGIYTKIKIYEENINEVVCITRHFRWGNQIDQIITNWLSTYFLCN